MHNPVAYEIPPLARACSGQTYVNLDSHPSLSMFFF